MSIMSQLNQPVLYLICGGINLFVALVATLCVSVVRPIMAVIAVNVLHLALVGTWIFGLSEIVLRFVFFYPRFASGKWKDKKV